jgi:hypothetical protein
LVRTRRKGKGQSARRVNSSFDDEEDDDDDENKNMVAERRAV